MLASCLEREPVSSATDGGQSNRLTYAAVTARQSGLVDAPLRRLIRYYNSTTGDHMTDHRVYSPAGYTREGLIWYVLDPTATTNAAVNSLYGVYDPATGDHMTSGSTSEGTYSLYDTFGKPLSNPDGDMGLAPIMRYFKNWTAGGLTRTDHMDAINGEVPAGYTLDGGMGYGWPTAQWVGTIQSFTKNGITIGSSRNWGGTIVSLSKNGIEYINRFDAGRDLSIAMWYGPEAVNHDNPTEGGDVYADGSPVLSYPTSPPTNGVLQTKSLALQWCQGRSDCSQDKPLLSGTEIAKTVTIQTANRVRFQTSFTQTKNTNNLPDAGAVYFNHGRAAVHEIVTSYLNDGIFDSLYVYNWTGSSWNQRVRLPASVDDGASATSWVNNFNANSAYIMASNSAKTVAIALFKKASDQNRTEFGWFRHLLNQSGGSPTSDQTLKLNILNWQTGVVSGTVTSYNDVYVLIGSESEIRSQAESLRTGAVQ